MLCPKVRDLTAPVVHVNNLPKFIVEGEFIDEFQLIRKRYLAIVAPKM
jgi:hypothetical protein